MDREKETLDVIQGLIDIVKTEQSLRASMQKQIDNLIVEVAGLRTEVLSGRAR